MPTPIDASHHLGAISPAVDGRASAVEVRGTVSWVTHRDGPVRALASGSAVRRRLPVVVTLGRRRRLDHATPSGDDAIELWNAADEQTRTLAPARSVGCSNSSPLRTARCSPAPATTAACGCVTVATGELREIDRTDNGDITGLAFSPDSRWLAWSHPGPPPLAQIRLAEVADPAAAPIDVTPLRFADTEPAFSTDGKYLAFLSTRSFDPIYDAYVFDLSFPNGCRPQLVALAGDDAVAVRSGRCRARAGAGQGRERRRVRRRRRRRRRRRPRPAGGPVPRAGRSLRLVARRRRWLRVAARPARRRARRRPRSPRRRSAAPRPGALRPDVAAHRDARSRPSTGSSRPATATASSSSTSTRCGSSPPTARWRPRRRRSPTTSSPSTSAACASTVTPGDEWRQMYDEAGRLMRDHYFRADMNGVDWDAALARYRPLVERARLDRRPRRPAVGGAGRARARRTPTSGRARRRTPAARGCSAPTSSRTATGVWRIAADPARRAVRPPRPLAADRTRRRRARRATPSSPSTATPSTRAGGRPSISPTPPASRSR